jgi:hypothetical protein
MNDWCIFGLTLAFAAVSWLIVALADLLQGAQR